MIKLSNTNKIVLLLRFSINSKKNVSNFLISRWTKKKYNLNCITKWQQHFPNVKMYQMLICYDANRVFWVYLNHRIDLTVYCVHFSHFNFFRSFSFIFNFIVFNVFMVVFCDVLFLIQELKTNFNNHFSLFLIVYNRV